MPLYMSAEERRQVLLEYSGGLRVFIETGTNTGDTPWFLQNVFEELYTIELDDDLYIRACERFAKVPTVTCLQGDSTDVLPKLLKRIKSEALVWLDGHHSGPGTGRGELDTPVAQELEALFADKRKHIILVDDARIFAGQPEHDDEPHYADYPSCEWVEELADENDYDYVLKNDIMRLTPRAS